MYALNYCDGKAASIRRLSDGADIGLSEGNPDYRAFLDWNAIQATPLDLKSTVEVVKPVARDLAAEITALEKRLATTEKALNITK